MHGLVERLLRVMTVNALIGNCDAHARNFSGTRAAEAGEQRDDTAAESTAVNAASSRGG